MKLENQSNYNCRVRTDTGEEYLLYANWLHNNQQDHWQGWQCNAGATRLYIDKDLNVFSGECENDCLGTVFDFDLLNSTVCKRDRCGGCTDDLMVAKKQRG
jgi:hypothetical protein